MLTYKRFSLVDFCSWRIMWLAGSSSLGTVVNQNRLLSVSRKSEGLSVPESDLFLHQKTNVRRSAAFVSIEVSVVRLNGFQEIIQQNAAYTSSVTRVLIVCVNAEKTEIWIKTSRQVYYSFKCPLLAETEHHLSNEGVHMHISCSVCVSGIYTLAVMDSTHTHADGQKCAVI